MRLSDDQIINKRPTFNHHHLWMLTCAQQCQLVPLTLPPHQYTNTTLTQTLPEDKWMNNSTTTRTPALLFAFTAWFMCFLISTQQDFALSGHLLYFPSVIQWRHWNNITYLTNIWIMTSWDALNLWLPHKQMNSFRLKIQFICAFWTHFSDTLHLLSCLQLFIHSFICFNVFEHLLKSILHTQYHYIKIKKETLMWCNKCT